MIPGVKLLQKANTLHTNTGPPRTNGLVLCWTNGASWAVLKGCSFPGEGGTWDVGRGVMQRPRETPACSPVKHSLHTAHLRAVKAESSRAQTRTPAGIHRRLCSWHRKLTTGQPVGSRRPAPGGPDHRGPWHAIMESWTNGVWAFHLKIPCLSRLESTSSL